MLRKIPQGVKGQGLIEYALILVLVAIVVIVVLVILGPSIGNIFSNIVAVLTADPAAMAAGPSGGPGGPGGPEDCYGSLLLPYLVGLTASLLLILRSTSFIRNAARTC